jgi:predicted metal-dependent hydrolase
MLYMDPTLFERGVALFNAGEFFEAHEVLEDVWRPAAGVERRFLQGLIQIAVALHHFSTGNLVGARSLLKRGASKLEDLPPDYCGVRVGELRIATQEWLGHLGASSSPQPPFPRL